VTSSGCGLSKSGRQFVGEKLSKRQVRSDFSKLGGVVDAGKTELGSQFQTCETKQTLSPSLGFDCAAKPKLR
jgi:hypothetical protein